MHNLKYLIKALSIAVNIFAAICHLYVIVSKFIHTCIIEAICSGTKEIVTLNTQRGKLSLPAYQFAKFWRMAVSMLKCNI